MSRWTTTLLAVVSMPAILTCGSGDATALPEGALTGAWVVEISSLAGSGATCVADAITLNLVQTGKVLHGTFQGGQVDCIYSGTGYTGNLGSGNIINGSFTHGDVAFDLKVTNFHFEGSGNDLTIGGTLLWQVIFSGTSRVFSLGGQWTATPE